MHKRRRIYEAEEKIIFEGSESGTYIQFFKDELLKDRIDGKNTDARHDSPAINGKAVLHNRISEYIFMRLQEVCIPTYFIKSLNMREQLVHIVEMIPLTLVCRNNISPSLARRLGLEAGEPLPRPLIEFYYANDELGNPLVSEEHILTFDWASGEDLEDMVMLSIRINDVLSGLFAAVGLRLADIRMKFGRLWNGDTMQLVLAGEISPDTCALWDREKIAAKPLPGNKIIDKIRDRQQSAEKCETDKAKADEEAERFRSAGYADVARRLGLLIERHISRG